MGDQSGKKTTNNTGNISEGIRHFRDFIGGSDRLFTFLHNTDTEERARRILREGLVFENHLLHTSDHVSGTDLIELNYFRMIRRFYGDYTVVIQIDSRLVEDFSRRLRHTSYHFSEALSKTRPTYTREDNPVYILPEEFIRGYFDHHTLTGHSNPRFNPFFFPLYFEDNLQRLLAKESTRKK